VTLGTGQTPAPRTISRRGLLAAGAASLVVGVAGSEAGNVALRRSTGNSHVIPPDVDLMEEHGVLKRVLLIYREALSRLDNGHEPPTSAIHQGALVIHDFIEAFHEALGGRCRTGAPD
jgi:hypothetical protein